MPILDGYQATSMIRSLLHSHNLPQPIIIAVTGHTEDSYVKKAWAVGMNEISPKPIDQMLLKDVLSKLRFI
jgi:CheY-like chemotaxis protein